MLPFAGWDGSATNEHARDYRLSEAYSLARPAVQRWPIFPSLYHQVSLALRPDHLSAHGGRSTDSLTPPVPRRLERRSQFFAPAPVTAITALPLAPRPAEVSTYVITFQLACGNGHRPAYHSLF